MGKRTGDDMTDAITMCEEVGVDPDLQITRFSMQDAALVLIRDTEMPWEEAVKCLKKDGDPTRLSNALLEASNWSDIFLAVLT